MSPPIHEIRGYQPVDLTEHLNAPWDVLDDADDTLAGDRTLHGLPFRFGPEGAGPAIVRVGAEPLRIELDPQGQGLDAPWLVLAHAVEAPDLFGDSRVGDVLAEYRLRHGDGSTSTIPIRQRFEIGPTPRRWEGRPLPLDWGQTPFLALPDSEHRLMHRTCGRFDAAGARLVDIDDPQARSPYVLPYRFYLWPWRNPRPEVGLVAVELRSLGPVILLGALTLGLGDEEPFGRTVSQDVVFRLGSGLVDESVSVEVDRGSSTYAYRTAAEGLSTPPGWGGRAEPHRGYVRVSATPSALVTLERDGKPEAEFRWGDLLTSASLTTDDGTAWELVGAGRTWLATTIVDDETGLPLPCRVHVHGESGIPVAPYGHHAHINSEGNSWNLDVGGDVRLGERTYAYLDGRFEGWMPTGRVQVEVAAGFEYEPLAATLDIAPGQRDAQLRLRRAFDPEQHRYVAGDTHVHFVSTTGAALEARGEGVRVVNLLLSQWGHMFSNTEDFTGRPYASGDGRTFVHAGQENRTAALGHLSLLGLRQPILPWSTGGAEEADLGGGMETTLSHWADECREQGGTTVLAHFPVPNGEAAALIATGRLDAVELIAYDDYAIDQYYRYLNAGYRLTLAGGTDKMSSDVPIGLVRTWARVPDPATMDYWHWCEGLRSGDTVVSSGPFLRLAVDGQPPGACLTGVGGDVSVRVDVASIFPVERVEVVRDGKVVHTQTWTDPTLSASLDLRLPIDADSWIAARCYGPADHAGRLDTGSAPIPNMHTHRHHDVWERPVVAHTSPVYLATGAEYDRTDPDVIAEMLALVQGSMEHLRFRARTDWPVDVHHRHGRPDHLEYLLEPLREAEQVLAARSGGAAPVVGGEV